MANETETQSLRGQPGDSVGAMLHAYSEMLYKDLSRNRFAEEREWYEDALFYQRRQWLKWDNSNKRWSLIKQDPDKPRPMPVTNHYARTINANANQLGSGNVRVSCIPNDDSTQNRRAAQFAERAIDAADTETNFEVLKPILAKQTTLWGMGVTKDYFDTSRSNGTTRVPEVEIAVTQMLGCLDCGQAANIGGDLALNQGAPALGQQDAPCPYCGSQQTVPYQQPSLQVKSVKQFSKGRLITEVRPIFEVFLPRDCQNPNLAKKLQHRYRKPLQECKALWAEAEDLEADEKHEIHEIYLEALRSLINYNYMHDQTGDEVTITETYAEFGQLDEELQDALREAVQQQNMGLESDEPGEVTNTTSDGASGTPGLEDPGSAGGTSEAAAGDDDEQQEQTFEAPDGELDPVEQLEQYGIYIIDGGGKCLDWGINCNEGKSPFTFYLWEVDPANVYPKGLGVDLTPLQKRLNRLDSLMELGMMSNAAGKWVWPTTQTTKPPTGSPTDVIEYDPVGDGKDKPEFVQPSPFHAACFSLRAAILQDFMSIGLTEGIQQGQAPGNVSAFRGLAYLGAKAAEQISTQRFLWETGHRLRYEKLLGLAKRNWDEPRKVKVRGFNGGYAMKQLWGRDLEGEYTLTVVPDSSKPKTPQEKEQAFAMGLESGLIDPMDPGTRDYALDSMNLDGVNLTNHYQYLKAERDLDSVIAGEMPELTPYIDIDIHSKIFTTYTLTEEYDAQSPQVKQNVLMACQMLSQAKAQQVAQQATMMAAAAGAGVTGAPNGPTPGQKMAGAIRGKQKAQPGLNGVPGVSQNTQSTDQEALGEGNAVAAALP